METINNSLSNLDLNNNNNNNTTTTNIGENVGQDLPIVNINIGIMGHVDSGKTSLAKVLSTKLSTAALDKSPSSQERGITLDLGFSSFLIKKPSIDNQQEQTIQCTLVDCPGHASLIKTIIGGSQIIDLMFLVIDISKGIQTQTAECIVIGEITCKKAIVILNKIDKIPLDQRDSKVKMAIEKLSKVLEKTKSFKDSPIIPISTQSLEGIDKIHKEIENIQIPSRDSSNSDFLFEFDHCFQIKGQGTILTGTILRGNVEVNQTIQIPQLNIEKKVKSMQMFHKSIKKASQGDRVGICVTQLNSKLLERGLVCSNNSVPLLSHVICSVEKVRFFKLPVCTKSQFHISIGHSTVLANATFFGNKSILNNNNNNNNNNLEFVKFNSVNDYLYQEELSLTSDNEYPIGSQFVFLKFEHPIYCPNNSVLIGSKLDTALDTNSCRIAFYGYLLDGFTEEIPSKEALYSKLKIYKFKSREGQVERIHNENTLIGKNLFQKDTDLTSFIGMKVEFANNITGVIESSFGKSGKVKIYVEKGVENISVNSNFKLVFKRYIYDKEKSNKQ